jgi:hypothetical protein
MSLNVNDTSFRQASHPVSDKSVQSRMRVLGFGHNAISAEKASLATRLTHDAEAARKFP